MVIIQDDVCKVVYLVCIVVDDVVLFVLVQELNGILYFMEQLNEVDVEGVELMIGVEFMCLKWCEDVVIDGEQQDLVLKNVFDVCEGFFVVLKVVE